MKKLPKIFQNEINKEINNNSTIYYCTTKNSIKEEKENININKFIDDLFREKGYIFNKQLIIKTKDKEYDTAIVKKNGNIIYTLTDDIININDIIFITKK